MNRALTIIFLAALTLAVFVYAADTPGAADEAPNTAVLTEFALDGAYSDWAEDELLSATRLGMLTGRAGDYTDEITRAGFCSVVDALMLRAGAYDSTVPQERPFDDTEDPAVARLYAAGIAKGKSERYFDPDATLTREEAATFTYRAAVSLGVYLPELMDDYPYSDVDAISVWALSPVRYMFAANIMRGVGDFRFSPAENYTWEQAAATALRLYDYYMRECNENSLTAKLADGMGDGNWCVSPFSVRCALALAATGADGDTRDQIYAAAGISDADAFADSAADLIARYADGSSMTLAVADSIWLNTDRADGSVFSAAYKKLVSERFGAEARTVTDKNAVAEVNKWTSDATRGKIKEIVSTPEFSALLANAVYFKGAWENEFYAGATAEDDFRLADGTTARTDFMHVTDRFNVYVDDNIKLIELPFSSSYSVGEWDVRRESGKDVSMFILIGETADAERTLRETKLARKKVELSLPKFRIETTVSLSDMLKSWGMSDAFDSEAADFRPMFSSGNMFVTDVLHKTYIDVDEEGAEAAAVTAIMMATTSMPAPEEIIEFNADEPFTYIIRENVSGEILFAGEYNAPAK